MSNTQQKKAARDYQRLHPGTSYTEALRRIRTRPVTLRLQLEQNGPIRPKALFIDGRTAAIGDQDIWRGDPIRVVGFTETTEPGTTFELLADNWLAYDPEACLGLYPVTANADDRWSTITAPVESVTVLSTPAVGLPSIDDLVAAAVRPYSVTITEAHHDDNEFYRLGEFGFATDEARNEFVAKVPVFQHNCQDPDEKACYLLDVCDENGDMMDNVEISAATARHLLDVDDLAPLRETAREFNQTINDPAFWS